MATQPAATQPAEAVPAATATDAPSYSYAPVVPVRRARPRTRVVLTRTPVPQAITTYNAPPAAHTPVPQPTDTSTVQPSDTPAAATPAAQPSDTRGVPTQAADTATATPPSTVSTAVDDTGNAAPTDEPATPPPADTPVAATAIPAQSGDQGSSPGFNLGNVAVSAQALDAVYYANNVYMQVMNARDTSNVDSAFGAALASTNRGVAANLAANNQHWNINLVGMSLSNAQVIDANTVRVTVTKSETAELLSDSGRVIKPTYTDTETFVDIVQRSGGRWLVTQVYH